MKLKFKTIAGLVSAFALGCLAAVLYQQGRLDVDSAQPSRAVARGSDLLAQRDYGYRCATGTGICVLDIPQAIGSVCQCPDGSKGNTVR